MKRVLRIGVVVALSAACGACATIAQKTNMLSDSSIVKQCAGVIGVSPADLVLQSRKTQGTNTYVQLRAKGGKGYHCLINGGNLLSMGMANPPECALAGQPINAGPFSG